MKLFCEQTERKECCCFFFLFFFCSFFFWGGERGMAPMPHPPPVAQSLVLGYLQTWQSTYHISILFDVEHSFCRAVNWPNSFQLMNAIRIVNADANLQCKYEQRQNLLFIIRIVPAMVCSYSHKMNNLKIHQGTINETWLTEHALNEEETTWETRNTTRIFFTHFNFNFYITFAPIQEILRLTSKRHKI